LIYIAFIHSLDPFFGYFVIHKFKINTVRLVLYSRSLLKGFFPKFRFKSL
jgi:hypothetical protein